MTEHEYDLLFAVEYGQAMTPVAGDEDFTGPLTVYQKAWAETKESLREAREETYYSGDEWPEETPF